MIIDAKCLLCLSIIQTVVKFGSGWGIARATFYGDMTGGETLSKYHLPE